MSDTPWVSKRGRGGAGERAVAEWIEPCGLAQIGERRTRTGHKAEHSMVERNCGIQVVFRDGDVVNAHSQFAISCGGPVMESGRPGTLGLGRTVQGHPPLLWLWADILAAEAHDPPAGSEVVRVRPPVEAQPDLSPTSR